MIKRIIKTVLLAPARLVLGKESILDFILETDEKELIKMRKNGYLLEKGWFHAAMSKASVDADNNPIPWISYNAAQFIDSRLKKSFNVFEFGGGNSTLYYAAKVNSVTTVEHDKSWYDKIKSGLPGNVNLLYKELERGGEYCKTASLTGKTFDLIVVDGRDRVNCILNSLSTLSDDGVLILDDSERDYYIEGTEFLKKNGFKRIDFDGIPPGFWGRHSLAVFYRENNCFGI